MTRHLAAFAATSAIALMIAAPALAADAGAASGPTTVDQITVTAQKRTESLQNVPVVVTAVSGALLQDAGVRDIKDLTVLTPGLMVTSSSSDASTTARIRGVGTVGDNLGLESSVGVVVDGVYRPRNSVGFGDLGELQRIEVLKGPQGTLFGKNTSAGVINIISTRPSFAFGASAEATFSNYNGKGFAGSVTGPIVADKIAGRLYFANRVRDGFYSVNVGPGPRTTGDDQDQDYYTARGQLLFTPVDSFDFNLIADISNRREHCCVSVTVLEGPTAAYVKALDPATLGAGHGGLIAIVDPYSRLAFANRGTPEDIKDEGISGEANWRTGWLGDAVLTSITAARQWQRHGMFDPDYSTADVITYDPTHQSSAFKQFSQELRLAGRSGKLDWMVGGFFATEELNQNTTLRYGTQFEPYASLLFSSGATQNLLPQLLGNPTGSSFVAGQGSTDHYDQKERNFAFFTNDTFHVTDKLEVTAGLRYTNEHKTLDSLYTNTDGGIGCAALSKRLGQSATAIKVGALLCNTTENPNFNNLPDHQSLSEGETNGTIKLAYRWTPEVLTYASYARGYKAGGFNLDRLACPYQITPSCGGSLQPVLNTSFAPEFVDSYELGAKNTLLDRKLLLNATLFYQKFTGFQLNAFNGLVFTVTSVPEVVSTGLDADFVYLPGPGWSIQGGLTMSDTQYGTDDAKVLGVPCTSIASGAPASAGVPAGCSLLPGSRLSFAPKYSATLAVTRDQDIGHGLFLHANVSGKYTSDYSTGSDLVPAKLQKGFGLVNARLGIGPANNRWSVEVWSQNLFDQHYRQVTFDAPLQSGTFNAFLGQPRTYGVTLRASY